MLLLAVAPVPAAPLVGGYADFAAKPASSWQPELARLVQSGASSIRLPLDWNRVEPRPAKFTWKADDAVVNAARAKGLDVVLILGPAAVWAVDPAWQVPPKERAYSIPKSMKTWERYVKEAATHFKGRVRYWQVREHPTAAKFRGARSEFLRLVTSAARVLRSVDPAAKIIVPEAGNLDIAEIDRLCSSDVRNSCDIFAAYPPTGQNLANSVLAWAVLSREILDDNLRARHRVWVLGDDQNASDDVWIQQYLLASAFGVERVYAPVGAISGTWLAPLSQLRYWGHLRLGPEVYALVFEDSTGPVVLAWAVAERDVFPTDLAPIGDTDAFLRAAALGDAPGSAIHAEDKAVKLRLGPRPVLIRGLDTQVAMHPGMPSREDVLAARTEQPDVAASPSVYVDYSRPDTPEFGLYNRPLRSRVAGRCEEEMRSGKQCLRTRISGSSSDGADNPWIYFDVDDRWLYFARGKTPVAITVDCEASYMGEKALGFNIWYDSTTGYRFSPWQWVEAGSGWRRYRVEIPDASFADRNGFDFRINVKGSRQDIWVSSVTVEKLTPGTAAAAAR